MERSILLASGSPQRRAILTQLGLRFRVLVPAVPELEEGDPVAVVAENARRKARVVVDAAEPGELIVACDTEVAFNGRVYGKPADVGDAGRMLADLRGQTHSVLGGLCVLDPAADQLHELVASTDVTFRTPAPTDLVRYLAGGEWAGRAGGYAIQGTGAMLVDRIDGCYQNVVGFPVAAFLDLIDREGIALAHV